MGPSSIRRRRAFAALVVAGGHLGCVALGALRVDLNGGGPLSRAFAHYGTLSGADSAYGFFAPDVAALPWAFFEVTEATGAISSDVLERGANREADIRVRNIIGTFWNVGTEPLRRALAASWAGKVFARHPGARSVVVRLESYDLPSMKEVREGKTPRWVVHYEAKFIPRARLRAAEETP
jgi:hypothetical protein